MIVKTNGKETTIIYKEETFVLTECEIRELTQFLAFLRFKKFMEKPTALIEFKQKNFLF